MPFVKNCTGLSGRYEGKTVLVTGGTRGIGEGCVRVFLEAGANVAFCSNQRGDGERLEAELTSLTTKRPSPAKFFYTDISDSAAVERLVHDTVRHFGQLDCLINNAGAHPPHTKIDSFSLQDATSLMHLNFFSVFVASKVALPYLRKTHGNIINMSSLVGAFGQVGACTYAASKGAITSFSKALAIDEAANKVRVNIVSPGNIWTPLWKELSAQETDPEKVVREGDLVQVLGRKGTIEESGRLCLCIASDLTFTTGVDHMLTGGAEIGYGSKF